jgi:hypothetical protein
MKVRFVLWQILKSTFCTMTLFEKYILYYYILIKVHFVLWHFYESTFCTLTFLWKYILYYDKFLKVRFVLKKFFFHRWIRKLLRNMCILSTNCTFLYLVQIVLSTIVHFVLRIILWSTSSTISARNRCWHATTYSTNCTFLY